MKTTQHQYIDRDSGEIKTEKLFGDAAVRYLYANARENAPALFRALTSSWSSSVLGYLNFDMPFGHRLFGGKSFLDEGEIDLSECLEDPETFTTYRKLFERKIRYWETRPMPDDPYAIVAPSDARVIIGSFRENSYIYLKGKYFEMEDLVGYDKTHWLEKMVDGDFAIFRLTPEKYHYNHVPVSGRVVDIYEIDGGYHSCNPGAVVAEVTPYSKNKRVVTVIDTDVEGGANAGHVIMIEVVALMIGEIKQVYSESQYENPQDIKPGMFLRKGMPKSLFRPGSSTVVLLFEHSRTVFAEDIVHNMRLPGVESRFSKGFDQPLIETDLRARSLIATAWPEYLKRGGHA
ncbi:MAG: phosphatidylserine decarboxylase [Nitrospinae bacterium]|nr:phosphatidylserine decarboxylase [Nitrospinota bacterium]